eukprot:UN28024
MSAPVARHRGSRMHNIKKVNNHTIVRNRRKGSSNKDDEPLYKPKVLTESNFSGGDIDVLTIVKKGCTLLKQGQWGSPHYRRFQMSSDGSALMWYSVKKPLEHTTVYVADMHSCLLKSTEEPHGRSCQDLDATFFVIYGAKKRTLEIVGHNRIEAKIWVTAISYLIKQANAGIQVSKLHHYYEYIDSTLGCDICPSFQARIDNSTRIFQQNLTLLKNRTNDLVIMLNRPILKKSRIYLTLTSEITVLRNRLKKIQLEAHQLLKNESNELNNNNSKHTQLHKNMIEVLMQST